MNSKIECATRRVAYMELRVHFNEAFEPDAMALDAVGFAPHELLAIAIEMGDREGTPLYSVEEGMEYLSAKYRVDDPSGLTEAICHDLNRSADQVRYEIAQSEELRARVAALDDCEGALKAAREARDRELRAFSEGVQKGLDELDGDLELEKANILSAMAHTYARRCEERLAAIRIPKFSRDRK